MIKVNKVVKMATKVVVGGLLAYAAGALASSIETGKKEALWLLAVISGCLAGRTLGDAVNDYQNDIGSVSGDLTVHKKMLDRIYSGLSDLDEVTRAEVLNGAYSGIFSEDVLKYVRPSDNLFYDELTETMFFSTMDKVKTVEADIVNEINTKGSVPLKRLYKTLGVSVSADHLKDLIRDTYLTNNDVVAGSLFWYEYIHKNDLCVTVVNFNYESDVYKEWKRGNLK